MPDSINFVRDQRKKLSKQQVQDRLFFKYAAIACGISFGLFVIAVATRIYFSFEVGRLIEGQDDQRATIQAQESNEVKYLLFAAKLEELSKLFINRRNKQETISYFSTLFGGEVIVNDIKYEADNAALTFSLNTKNIFGLDQVLNTLNSQTVKERFQGLSVETLTRDDKGEYQTNIRVVLKHNT